MKEEKNKKKFNKKKLLTFGVLGIFAIALVAAGLATYYAQKQVEMTITSPVVFNGETILIEEVTLIAGDGYNLYLVEGENLLDRVVDVEFKFVLLNGEEVLADTEGFYLAYSDDIQYAYNPEYGNINTWANAQTWMFANLDWFDWVLTGDLIDYDASVITNHGGNSAYENMLPFNTPIPEDLEPGKFYAVVYLDIDEAVIPGDYTLSIDMMPITA